MNNEIPPFHIGQRVICLKDGTHARVKKGDTVTVVDIFKSCCHWSVCIGAKIPDDYDQNRIECCHCKRLYHSPKPGYHYSKSENFRAITDDFQAISFEKVLEQELTSVN